MAEGDQELEAVEPVALNLQRMTTPQLQRELIRRTLENMPPKPAEVPPLPQLQPYKPPRAVLRAIPKYKCRGAGLALENPVDVVASDWRFIYVKEYVPDPEAEPGATP